MIQDISPYTFHIEYQNIRPEGDDLLLPFCRGKLLLRREEPIAFLKVKDWRAEAAEHMIYLFAIDDMRFFYLDIQEEEAAPYIEGGCSFTVRRQFRNLAPKHLAFAGVTACMLDGWYASNQYCGRCGHKLVQDTKERMLFCPDCNQRVYPRINPAVIVAVTKGNQLLLTTYKGREYKNYALVAGFTEVGESFEDTVRREVMEEAGLKVKNIRYYGSQPWAFADNILAGYFCEVDGESEIRMDAEELASAAFYARDEIDVKYTDSSLTNEMICAFKNRKV